MGILFMLACNNVKPVPVEIKPLTEQQRIHAYMDSAYKSHFIKYLAK